MFVLVMSVLGGATGFGQAIFAGAWPQDDRLALVKSPALGH
jgi:hypothetical protein